MILCSRKGYLLAPQRRATLVTCYAIAKLPFVCKTDLSPDDFSGGRFGVAFTLIHSDAEVKLLSVSRTPFDAGLVQSSDFLSRGGGAGSLLQNTFHSWNTFAEDSGGVF